MKKSEGELLREYAKIIAEADYDPSEVSNFKPEDDHEDVIPSAHNADEYESSDDDFTVEDESASVDPVTELGDYLSYKDPNNLDFAAEIEKFLHEKGLELTPVGGLADKQGAV